MINKLLRQGRENPTAKCGDMYVIPQMVCKDGFKFSVQASWGHYCTPRNSVGEYTHVEVGYPSQVEEALLGYSDGENPIFGYVPIEVVEKIIVKHGGFSHFEKFERNTARKLQFDLN